MDWWPQMGKDCDCLQNRGKMKCINQQNKKRPWTDQWELHTLNQGPWPCNQGHNWLSHLKQIQKMGKYNCHSICALDIHWGCRLGSDVCVPSCVWLFVTLWTTARHIPLSMGPSQQEYWSGLPFPPPRNLSNLGIKPVSPEFPELQVDSLHWATEWSEWSCSVVSDSLRPHGL